MRRVPRLVAALVAALYLFGAETGSARAETPPPSAAARASSLARAVEDLDQWAAKQGVTASVAVLDARGGRLLAALHETVALNPASNTKIFTAAAALERLGPDYRYLTGLYGVLRDGATGDLVLRGHGDPSLRALDLRELAEALAARGLKRVGGRILVDQSRFDDDYTPPGFEQRPGEWASFRAPVSAVALEKNTVALNVLATEEGKPATLWFEPPGFVQISGSVETRPPGSGQAIGLKLRPDKQRLKAEVSGQLARGLGLVRLERRVDDPRLLAGFVLAHLLRSAGVDCRGEVALGGSSEQNLLVAHRSEALAVLVHQLGKHSDNFYAEMILKTLGAEAGTGSSARGAEAVLAWLKQAGAEDRGTVIKNGSGLYDANRASALALARALVAVESRPSIAAEFVGQLAVGGVDGTLKSRFRQYSATRVVRGKTGTLANVDALSGYVLAPQGRPPFVFSILLNGPLGDHREARRLIDRVVEKVAEAVALAHR